MNPDKLADFLSMVYERVGVAAPDARLLAESKARTAARVVVDAGAVAVIDGLILPMAGHKGYAIAVVIDMLAGVLSGSEFLSGVHGPYETAKRSGAGHFLLALNIEAFMPLAEFNARMERYIAELKSVPRAPGVEEVFYPGEIEARNDVRNRREGLALPEETLADLAQIARQVGVPFEV